MNKHFKQFAPIINPVAMAVIALTVGAAAQAQTKISGGAGVTITAPGGSPVITGFTNDGNVMVPALGSTPGFVMHDAAGVLSGGHSVPGIAHIYTSKPTASIVAVGPGETKTTNYACAEGYYAISGGYGLDQPGANAVPIVIHNGFGPSSTYDPSKRMFKGWSLVVKNIAASGTANASVNATIYITCAKFN